MKKKVSRFEYGLLSVIEPENLDNYEEMTESEERQIRAEKLNKQLDIMHTLDGKPLGFKFRE